MSVAQPVTFGQLLKRYRQTARLSQEALAERAGLAVRSVSDLERDVRRLPHPDTIQRLADALHLSPQDRALLARTTRRGGSLSPPSETEERSSPLIPFIGRTRALDLFERSLAGREPLMLLFGGEPGIGKTRLLREAAARAQAVGWRVLAGGCTRRSAQASYAPFTGALAQAIARTPHAQLRRDLQGCAWLARLLPELAEHALTPALGWTIPPEQEQRLLFASVGRYLANVAGPSGTLVMLDDLQWAGGDALDLLESLIRLSAAASHEESEAPATPLRILGAYRDTEVQPSDNLGLLLADLARDGLAAQRPMKALDPREARVFADLLLAKLYDEDQGQSEQGSEQGDERSPHPPLDHSELVEQIVQRAGGVPFFLVSCALGLRANGGEDEPDVSPVARTTTPETPSEHTPWQVTTNIRQRVAALPHDAQLLLGALSVAGRAAPFALLATMLARPKKNLLHAVEAACHARLLEEAHSEAPHLASYQFPHDLIRETILRDLSAARREVLHRAAGDAIETLGFHERRPAELAYHFAQAEEFARALPYALQAGDQAEAAFAHSEASAHFRAAIFYAEAAGDLPHKAEALEKLGVSLLRFGHTDPALAALEASAQLYAEFNDQESRYRALAALIQTHWQRGTAEEGLAKVRPILAAAEEQGKVQASPALAALYNAVCGAHRHDGQHGERASAAKHLERLARDLHDDALLFAALHHQIHAAQISGIGAPALIALLDLAPLAERIGDPVTLLEFYNNIAAEYLLSGEFSLSLAYNKQALEQAQRTGGPPHITRMLINRAELHYYRGA